MDALIAVLLIAGLVFFSGGTVGILRFPDAYTRLHAAGKMDTMGSLLTTVALALATLKPLGLSDLLTAAKIILIVAFVFVASPTATHAIVDAGLRAGLEPWQKQGARERK